MNVTDHDGAPHPADAVFLPAPAWIGEVRSVATNSAELGKRDLGSALYGAGLFGGGVGFGLAGGIAYLLGMHAWWLPGIVAGVILAAVALYVVAQPEWLACTYVGSAGVAIVASRGGGPVRTRGVRFADAVHLQMTATDHRQHTMIVSGSISLVWTNGFKREVFSYAGTVWTQETAELGHPAGPFCRAACTAWDERSR